MASRCRDFQNGCEILLLEPLFEVLVAERLGGACRVQADVMAWHGISCQWAQDQQESDVGSRRQTYLAAVVWQKKIEPHPLSGALSWVD